MGLEDFKNIRYETSVALIYGSPLVTIPEGFKATSFRPPEKGDIYLSADRKSADNCVTTQWDSPRLILKKLEPRVVTFIEDPNGSFYETVDGSLREKGNYNGGFEISMVTKYRRVCQEKT